VTRVYFVDSKNWCATPLLIRGWCKTHDEACVGAVVEGVTNCTGRHSPPDIGGVDATSIRSREASFIGADGVVENGTSSTERIVKHFVNPDHPVCAAAVATHLFLMAQPPLLYQEGNCQPHIHSQLLRPGLQLILTFCNILDKGGVTGAKREPELLVIVRDLQMSMPPRAASLG